VVSHGFALNLTTNLEYFDGIVPCGHVEKRPTSVEALAGPRLDTENAARDYAMHFARVFGAGVEWSSSESVVAAGRA
jgi:lipoyl(octanoyl) transferase